MQLLRIVNPISDEPDEFVEFDQAGWVQNRRLLEDVGIRRRRSLISPLSWKSERAAAVLEQREHFMTANAADF